MIKLLIKLLQREAAKSLKAADNNHRKAFKKLEKAKSTAIKAADKVDAAQAVENLTSKLM